MARGSVANYVKLSWLLLRGGLRQAAGRLNGHPLLRWPLPQLKADRLLISPQDLRTADATLATEPRAIAALAPPGSAPSPYPHPLAATMRRVAAP